MIGYRLKKCVNTETIFMNGDKKKAERRNSSSHLIENMLNERKQLLALLMRASALSPDRLATEDRELLEEFCQVLVDYIAAGHFGLYERIAGGRERRQSVSEIAKQIYPEIEKITQQALEFTEKYNPEKKNGKLNNLEKDLSSLGELLTTRMELEDHLIARMLA